MLGGLTMTVCGDWISRMIYTKHISNIFRLVYKILRRKNWSSLNGFIFSFSCKSPFPSGLGSGLLSNYDMHLYIMSADKIKWI